MNKDRYISENHMEADRKLKEILDTSLPEAPENGWFTRRVMNRLPEKKRNAPMSIAEKCCYLMGWAGFVGAWIFSVIYTLNNGLSMTTFILAAILPVITLVCVGTLVFPAIRKAL